MERRRGGKEGGLEREGAGTKVNSRSTLDVNKLSV